MNPTVPPTITMKNMERIIMDATELHDFVQSEIKNPAHVVTNPQDIEEGQKAREAVRRATRVIFNGGANCDNS
jgi:hypothetical protein